MARVFSQTQAERLGLPGRMSMEIVSGQRGARAVTLRLVEIPAAQPGDVPRRPHWHRDFEECMFVLSGTGIMHAESGEHDLASGDAVLVPAGEKHVTRNTGDEPLRLLCFFPVAEVASGTQEPSRANRQPGIGQQPRPRPDKSL